MGDVGGYKTVENMELEEGDVETQTGNRGNRNKFIIGGVVAVVLLVVVAVVAVLFIGGFGGGKTDCSDDGFESVLAGDKKTFLKWKMFIKDEDNLISYKFQEAVEDCKLKGGELWEVHNPVEFDAIVSELSGNVWLGGHPANNCTSDCLATDADTGAGTPIRWESGYKSSFSLLRDGTTAEGMLCLGLDYKTKLWALKSCEDQRNALCVKRDCQAPEKEE